MKVLIVFFIAVCTVFAQDSLSVSKSGDHPTLHSFYLQQGLQKYIEHNPLSNDFTAVAEPLQINYDDLYLPGSSDAAYRMEFHAGKAHLRPMTRGEMLAPLMQQYQGKQDASTLTTILSYAQAAAVAYMAGYTLYKYRKHYFGIDD